MVKKDKMLLASAKFSKRKDLHLKGESKDSLFFCDAFIVANVFIFVFIAKTVFRKIGIAF